MPDSRDRFDDPDAPVTDEERAEAERLREALEDPARTNADAELARALSSAWSPRDLPTDAHARLIADALARHDGKKRRRVVVRVSFGASAVLAMAAAVALVVRGDRDRQPPETVVAAAALAVSRSTQPLFPDRFPSTGGETSRIDRIAMARATDLRDNEFAKWGVR